MSIDIALDDDLEIKIVDGDFGEEECTRSNQRLIVLIEKGELREFPERGVGIRSWLLEENTGSLNAMVKRELEADGSTVLQVSQKAGTLQIESTYE